MDALSSVVSIAGQILEHYEKIEKARAELRALVELVRTVRLPCMPLTRVALHLSAAGMH